MPAFGQHVMLLQGAMDYGGLLDKRHAQMTARTPEIFRHISLFIGDTEQETKWLTSSKLHYYTGRFSPKHHAGTQGEVTKASRQRQREAETGETETGFCQLLG